MLRTQVYRGEQDHAVIVSVKVAQWGWAPQLLVQRRPSEPVAARTSRVILDEGQYLTAPGEQLAGQLMEFGVDEATNEAVVVYQAMLVEAGGKTVTQRRLEAREPIGGDRKSTRLNSSH